MAKTAKKGGRNTSERKNYYKSPAERGVFHLGLELPIELREPFKQLAEANNRHMKAHAAFVIKTEVEKFQQAQTSTQPA